MALDRVEVPPRRNVLDVRQVLLAGRHVEHRQLPLLREPLKVNPRDRMVLDLIRHDASKHTSGIQKQVSGAQLVGVLGPQAAAAQRRDIRCLACGHHHGGSKHSAPGLTKSLAADLAPSGIRVLGVAPSFVPAEGTIAAAKAGMEDE